MTYFGGDGCGYEHPGDAKAAADSPPMPADWTAEERTSAYWYALSKRIELRSTESWRHVLADAKRSASRHRDRVDEQELFT